MKSKIPNNPAQAYQCGKRQGTQDNMDLIAMALTDKAGWHIKSEYPDDKCSIEWLYKQLLYYAQEINSGRIKRKDIKKALEDEHSLQFCD